MRKLDLKRKNELKYNYNMAVLNPRYEDIGKEFVTQYYALFDDPAQRPNLIHLFNVSNSNRFSAFFQFSKIESRNLRFFSV